MLPAFFQKLFGKKRHVPKEHFDETADSGKKLFHSRNVSDLYLGAHSGNLTNMKANTFFPSPACNQEGLEIHFLKGN